MAERPPQSALDVLRIMQAAIERQRQMVVAENGSGGAPDFQAYRYQVGRAAGLKEAAELCEQAYGEWNL